jgi:Protein of unknown function (DUF3579)
MSNDSSKEIFILGVTHVGKVFRPSDWAERLAGVMSSFREGRVTAETHLSYSPWCLPMSIGSAKCVVVHRALSEFNIMAWDFCINFAKDNNLMILDRQPSNDDVAHFLKNKPNTEHSVN